MTRRGGRQAAGEEGAGAGAGDGVAVPEAGPGPKTGAMAAGTRVREGAATVVSMTAGASRPVCEGRPGTIRGLSDRERTVPVESGSQRRATRGRPAVARP